jgi:hypothetical protein
VLEFTGCVETAAAESFADSPDTTGKLFESRSLLRGAIETTGEPCQFVARRGGNPLFSERMHRNASWSRDDISDEAVD